MTNKLVNAYNVEKMHLLTWQTILMHKLGESQGHQGEKFVYKN